MLEEIPTTPSTRCVVFGPSDSGKTTFIMKYAISVLQENPDSVCLIFARKEKMMRKYFNTEKLDEQQLKTLNRLLFKWVSDKNSLLINISELHLYYKEPISLVIIEDLLEIVNQYQYQAIIAHLMNAVETFKGCRIAVTLTPKHSVNILSFRYFMTHYVNTFYDKVSFGAFKKNSRKSELEMEDSLNIRRT